MKQETLLRQNSGCFDIKENNNISLIVDASESATDCQDAIVNLTNQLITRLPGGVRKRLFFLSNSVAYQLNRFPQNSPNWWRVNQLKGSFITPIAEQLGDDKVLVIGSGLIYDLEDWEDHQFVKNLVFAKMGNQSLRGTTGIGVELEKPTALDISQAIYSPIESVTITGLKFLPYYWDNLAYHLNRTAESDFELKTTNEEGVERINNYTVTVRFFGENISAKVRRQNEDKDEIIALSALETKDLEILDKVKWGRLDSTEEEIFKRAISNKSYTCPLCKHEHRPEELMCYNVSTFGRRIYQSLGTENGIFVLKENDAFVDYRHHSGTAIRLDNDLAAIIERGKIFQYRFNSVTGKWIVEEELHQYHHAGDEYLVAI
jgi:hypothetical protein